MARLEPFNGIRYDPERVEAASVLAPPYDVVGPAERKSLAARSPYNAIHVELPLPDPAAGLDRYAHAAALLEAWAAKGVLRRNPVRAFYLYRMRFVDEDGRPRVTTGLLGALGLDPGETGEVLPHEQTISKDKHDRLSLLRACRTNLSPIWGLSLAAGLGAACQDAIARSTQPPFAATDDDGVLHECWPVAEPGLLEWITRRTMSAPVLIADGHHRYATACEYAAETRAENGDRPGGHDLVLAFMVELAEEELSVRAIHRLVSGIDPDELAAILEPWFTLEPAPSDRSEIIAAMAARGALGMLTVSGDWLLVPTEALVAAGCDDLDSTRLKVALDAMPSHELTYRPGWREAAAAVDAGSATAAFLLKPVTIPQIERLAHDGRRMEPKSTYFHPKPRTGMVFRPLD
jgi:uncharacterized protein (DUF1015 family)